MSKLNKLLSDKTTDGLILAQINGTILAIFIGLFSAYYMYLFSKIDSMQFEIMKEANKINLVQGFIAGEDNKEFTKITSWTYSHNNMISILKELFFMGYGENSEKYSNNPIERGKIALFDISKLSSHYPFPPMVVKDDVATIAISTPQPLRFKNISEIEQWLPEIDSTVRTILGVYNDPTSKLSTNIKSYINTTKNPALLRHVFERFLNDAQSTNDILTSLKTQLTHYNIFSERHLSKAIFIIYLILSFATFLLSVILPMFKNSIPRLVIVGIPITFYCLSFALIIIEIAKF